ncbi:MAG: protein tyrosine phosphatase (PTP) superfamily phosphohydrolase (DUF442 family) [Paraglaciecola psychrophila]|jgi:protein tyrosine phosphatase (PTP) superfamily phosphohydrolase (DUF442 family)
MALLNQHVFSETIGSSGQPSEAQFSELAESGYQVIINLAMHDSDEAIANEGALVAALAMTYIHMPVPFDAPSDEHFSTFAAMMNALDGKKVWVHCQVNARVSAFLFRYLQRDKNFSAQRATSPLLTAWLPTMDDTWKTFTGL